MQSVTVPADMDPEGASRHARVIRDDALTSENVVITLGRMFE